MCLRLWDEFRRSSGQRSSALSASLSLSPIIFGALEADDGGLQELKLWLN
jgi:hypothetical protein